MAVVNAAENGLNGFDSAVNEFLPEVGSTGDTVDLSTTSEATPRPAVSLSFLCRFYEWGEALFACFTFVLIDSKQIYAHSVEIEATSVRIS